MPVRGSVAAMSTPHGRVLLQVLRWDVLVSGIYGRPTLSILW